MASLNEIDPLNQLSLDPVHAMHHIAEQLVETFGRYRLQENRELLRSLQSLQKRSARHPGTLAILGESRTSKSSLTHALLGITLDDAGIPPSTIACTYLAYGSEAEAAVTLTNSLTARLPLQHLPGFLGDKVRTANLRKVLVRLPIAALESGLVVIDTPELSANSTTPVSCLEGAVADADACVFVIDAGRLHAGAGLSQGSLSFLRAARGKLEKFFFVLEGAAGLTALRQQETLRLVTNSLREKCGLPQPRVTLLNSLLNSPPAVSGAVTSSAGPGDAAFWRKRSEAFNARLLAFAHVSSLASTADEAARLSAETLAYAQRALNSIGTPLRHAMLRRGVKALERLRTQAEAMARARNAAMRSFDAPAGNDTAAGPEQSFETAQSAGFSAQAIRAAAVEAARAAAVKSAESSVINAEAPAPPVSAREVAMPAVLHETSIPPAVQKPAFHAAEANSAEPIRHLPIGDATPIHPQAYAQNVMGSTPVYNPSVLAGETVVVAADPSDIPDSVRAWYAMPLGPPVKTRRRYFGRVAGLAALTASALAVLVAAVPHVGRPDAPKQKTIGYAEPPIQPGDNSLNHTSYTGNESSATVTAKTRASAGNTPPAPVRRAITQGAAYSEPYTVRQPDADDPEPDPSLQSALTRWVNTFRSGNIKAQVACYAPFVDTYFNWRNVRPEQVQYDKERAWRRTASVHKYSVTPVSITDQGNGRKAVLLQKDWDTTTTRGKVFSGSEIEKLVFARVEGQWKIVGEQEVKVLKLRRE